MAYLRTSSATNVGADKDSEKRQRVAIEAFAKRAGYAVVDWYYDADVRGSDPVDTRPGFAAMLERIAGNGVRTILVETANRFSRDLIVQETGHKLLKARGVALVAADSPDAFVEETPTSNMVRQILGVIAEFEKASLVAKLKGARDRKRVATGKCEGRKSYAERDPEMVALARKLHRYPVNGRRRSLRDVAAELAAAGYSSEAGTPFPPASIARMIGAANANAVRNAKADARALDLSDVLDEIRADGTTSLRGIAAALNERGIPATRGGKWAAPQVSDVLARIP